MVDFVDISMTPLVTLNIYINSEIFSSRKLFGKHNVGFQGLRKNWKNKVNESTNQWLSDKTCLKYVCIYIYIYPMIIILHHMSISRTLYMQIHR